ncbi:hypothetical protein BS78_04G182900 [Paspalum vaginatum]|nr:hypothetical protein BS78_04G182900 [Paspalum vaginatum]
MPVEEVEGRAGGGANSSREQTQDEDANDQGTITEFNPEHAISDLCLRIPIDQFSPNIRDEVRRAFKQRGPTQPSYHNFPKGQDNRSFQKDWFKQYDWLEYSLEKDRTYCFYCYIFRNGKDDDKFNSYLILRKHVGGPNSQHNRARTAYVDFDKEEANVKHIVIVQTEDAKANHIALQGEPFRGHDESENSLNKGNFLEFLDCYKVRNEEVRRAYEGCPKNAKMTFGTIQKEMATCCAKAVTKVIKEEMDGQVIERLLGIKHVKETTSEALKMAVVQVTSAHGLTIAQLREQGYDGASNMRGEFNGVQKLIHDENPYAFYIHCFAHQLQLVVVSVSRCCSSMEDFFDYVNMIVSSISASCKRKDLLLDNHHTHLLDRLKSGEISSGRGQHQETSLARPRDTRWGSHHKTLLRIETMWDSIIEVISIIHDDQRNPSRAGGLVHTMESFSLVFIMKMMLQILRITSELSSLLQKKDQNIVEAMSLVIDVKTRLVNLRSEGYEPLLDEAKAFCYENDIPIPNMEHNVPRFGRSRKGGRNNIAQDFITSVSSELLTCFACLDPRDSFSKFDVNKLARLTEIYLDDFSFDDRKKIKEQLRTFLVHVRRIEEFRVCQDLASLALKMAKLKRHIMFPLVYRLIELALLLPVATTSVERAFSAMKIIKTELRNKMSYAWLNDLMVVYIEREIFKGIDIESIKKAFQAKKDRNMKLPKYPRRNS